MSTSEDDIGVEMQEEIAARGWSPGEVEFEVNRVDREFRVELTRDTGADPVHVSRSFPIDTDPITIAYEAITALADSDA